jgi:AcrR family transcriptional regulator
MERFERLNGKDKMQQIPLRERNKQRSTRRIILAASELFKARGYHSTTMDDIAEKAEISRGTLFNYFPNKEALLLPWGQEIMDQRISAQLDIYLDTQPTVWQVFHFLFTKMSETMREYPDVIQAVIREAVESSHPGKPDWGRVDSQEVYLLVVRCVRYGQARGEIRSDLPLENMVSYLGALQMSLVFRMMDPSLAKNQSLEIEQLLAFLEGGLKKEKIELE